MATGGLPAEIFDGALAALERLAAESSASGDAAGLARVARRLAGELERRGLPARILERSGPQGPLPLLAAGCAGPAPPLLLVGHLDTVLPAIAPRREGDRFHATGAIDMKGGFAALLGALDLLARRGLAPPPDLALVAVPDEEVGGAISQAEMRARGAAARAIWVLEPGEPRGEAETLVTGRRGLFTWRVEARGRPAHSGLAFWTGRSALAAAAELAAAAAALSEPGRGPTVNVARMVAGGAPFVDELAAHADLPRSGRQLNVVAERALIEGEARYLAGADRDRIRAALAALAGAVAARSEVALDFDVVDEIAAVEPSAPGRALAARAVALAARRGWRLELEAERGGISFPNFLPDPSALPVLDGLGPVGGGMHTREEHLLLPSLARRIVLIADLLEAETRGDGAAG